MKPINVGLLGIGTVGGGTYTVLTRNQEEIARRAGRPIAITRVADRNLELARQVTGGKIDVTDDAFAIVSDPAIDIVVELIGGYTVARELVLKAIENGKHVVTANKALIACMAMKFLPLRRKKASSSLLKLPLLVVSPLFKAVREGLAANRIEWIAGIINGTTNFILSEMREKGLAFADVLKEAQRLGYAEADPTFDVEGIDAAHKLMILAAMLWLFVHSLCRGITKLDAVDITKRTDKGVELRVHPTLIPEKRLICQCEWRNECCAGQGRCCWPTLYYGAGAGAEPTASAVADLVDGTDRGISCPHLAFQPDRLVDLPILPIGEISSAYYLRLRAVDKPGVLADVTRILGDRQISIDAMIQKEPQEGEDQADIIILTHVTVEKNMDDAIAAIEALPAISGKVTRLRMEELSR
uniref:Homoserine dehydrogenase n=1 Tax=Methylobacillus glycogenes TaxID=406 RepID=DHON_METGL|nr:RecName: Full=Homoserine dehydrogenase; Short=HDH [Methylobacillus glycogenes]BAA40415.1 homoserine dehydrogenase [Methylobacillus glycogenes]